MILNNSIPENKKITVIFRVEPGSLGPNGVDHVEDFCNFAQLQLQSPPYCREYITWCIEPRLDKQLVEMEFHILSKKLPQGKVKQYLNLFGENLAVFEEQLGNNIEIMINQYFGR